MKPLTGMRWVPALVSPVGKVDLGNGRWWFAQQPETVEVKRRRQGASDGPQGRAEAPRRPGSRQPASGSGGGGAGGGGGSYSGGGAGGGGNIKLPWWAILLILIVMAVFGLFNNGGGDQTPTSTQPDQQQDQGSSGDVTSGDVTSDQPQGEVLSVQATPTARPVRNTPPPSASTGGRKWLVMMYSDADDKVLEQDMYLDLNEVERAGGSGQVDIVAQVDRFQGGYNGDGNWTSARRYRMTQDSDLNRIRSEMVDDLGEVNMSDGATLADFVTWAIKTYPAERYALVLSDHGMGWPGGWSDPSPGGTDPSRAPIARQLSDNLYTYEIDAALTQALDTTGVEKLDFIGMDACLMSQLEIYSMLAHHADYAVASEETEPALGWAYTRIIEELTANPAMDGGELGRVVVESYIQDDQRIVDDAARADFLRQGSPMGGMFGPSQVSADALAREMTQDVTLTAMDLSKVGALMQAFNDLAFALQQEDEGAITTARNYALSFTNIFNDEKNSPYLDLGSFLSVLKREGSSQAVKTAADQTLAALKSAVVAEKHGPGKKAATGVAIYFPNSTLYRTPVSGAQSYTVIANTFAAESLWDDFLAYHYNNRPIQKSERIPVVPPSTGSRAPGLGKITVSEITASSSSASANNPVKLTAEVSGTNIGYIYWFAGLYDPASNSIFVADLDFLESPESAQVDGVFYPKWPVNQPFILSLEWQPTLFSVNDGETTVLAALTPRTYGASAADAEYTLDGKYTFADGTTRFARLIFRDGKLRQVFGFNGDQSAGAPSEITPQPGDTFTVIQQWIDLDSSGRMTGVTRLEGDTLTFGDQMFTWVEQYAPAGDYRVGFIVEDLDGKDTRVYTDITVK